MTLDRFIMMGNDEEGKGMFYKNEMPSMQWGTHMGPYRRGLKAHQDTMMPKTKKRRMNHGSTEASAGGTFNPLKDTKGCGELVGPRSAQGLVVIRAQFEPEASPKVLPAFTLAFAKSQQSGGVVHIDNYNSARQKAPVIGVTLEDALDATKLMDEHASRRTVALAVGGVVAMHCPPAYAKEFVFGDPVYINNNFIHTSEFQGVTMKIPSWNKDPAFSNCRIGTFVEQVDSRNGGIRFKLDIGAWESPGDPITWGTDDVPAGEEFAPGAGSTGTRPKTNLADRAVDRQQRALWSMNTPWSKILAVSVTGLLVYLGMASADLSKTASKESFYNTMAALFRRVNASADFVKAFMKTKTMTDRDQIVRAFEELSHMGGGALDAYAGRIFGRYAEIITAENAFGTSSQVNFDPARITSVPDAVLAAAISEPLPAGTFVGGSGILDSVQRLIDSGTTPTDQPADEWTDELTAEWQAAEFDDDDDASTTFGSVQSERSVPQDIVVQDLPRLSEAQIGAMLRLGAIEPEDVPPNVESGVQSALTQFDNNQLNIGDVLRSIPEDLPTLAYVFANSMQQLTLQVAANLLNQVQQGVPLVAS